MENASKALLIVAGVMVGILILTLGVNLFISLGGFVKDTQAKIDEKNVQQFNEEFLKYDQKTNLTIHDVITAKNKAFEINKSYENYDSSTRADEDSYYVDVFFKRESSTVPIFNKDSAELLKSYEDVNNIKCTVTISAKTGRVYKVVFE